MVLMKNALVLPPTEFLGCRIIACRKLKIIPTNSFQHLSEPSSSHGRLKLPSLAISSDAADNILSNQDLIDGSLIAVILAFGFSYLNGRTPSSSNVKLWPNEDDSERVGTDLTNPEVLYGMKSNSTDTARISVFDANDWKEAGKAENYVLYTNKIRKNQQRKVGNTNASLPDDSEVLQKKNRLAFFALLVLFVPIFSVEFFFALSRQFVCGDFLTQVDDTLWSSEGISTLAKELCSPHLDR
jgi:hypothetical protein